GVGLAARVGPVKMKQASRQRTSAGEALALSGGTAQNTDGTAVPASPTARSRRAPGMKLHYHRHASGRLFENAFLERSSRVKPITPFVFYIPIIVVLQIWALWTGKTTWLWTLGMWPLGW